MRICQVSRTYPRDISPGSGSVAFNLVSRLPYQVLYVTKRLPGVYAPPPPNARLAVFSYPEPRVPARMNTAAAAWMALAKTAGAAWFLLQSAPAIARFQPDVLHLHSVLTALFAPFGKTVLRKPVALTFHGTDFVWFRKNRALQWLVDRHVDVVFCVAQEMADEMASLAPRPRVVTIPNGVDFEVFRDMGLARQRQIAAVGHLKWQKGYEYLVRAMRIVADRQPEVQLKIAGAGPLEQELRALAASLGLESNVQFLGVIPHAEVARLLNESRVYVMSSVSEGFPRALLEAMACGTPVAVTDVGECARVADGAGRVVPPRSPEALAEALLALLEDNEAWRGYAQQATARAQQFTWDEVARRTVSVYQELAPPRLAPASPAD